ncbi:hypothetical protein ACT6NV_06125 [Robiginitalea sp. IMCC44478]|uniref:hypothetical protein n=1 Tax=Robiginitalea sp. IMCC44478 TaxID=3459122 RepID=UPI0040438255
MQSYQHIIRKLEAFLNQYYIRELIKGGCLFVFSLGMAVVVSSVLEYLLWMGSGFRTMLFWGMLLLFAILAYRYLIVPILQLFRIKKGLSYEQSARLIGRHFPEVADRLQNLLELAGNKEKSDLLLASIEQRSAGLREIPFTKAIPLKEGYKYIRFVVVLAGIGVLIWVSGKGLELFQSYKRVVQYDMAFEAPAPFAFAILNKNLRTQEDKPFILRVRTEGKVQPESVSVIIGDKPFIMEDKASEFEYTFRPPLKTQNFYLLANGLRSGPYTLEVFEVPVVDRFEMELKYPAYLGMDNKTIKGTGNASVPEGTQIEWEISTVHTEALKYSDRDTSFVLEADNNQFVVTKKLFKDNEYSMTTSNSNVRDYDHMRYTIEVVPDLRPEIRVKMVRDSINPNTAYFMGEALDDHGLRKLELVYYAEGQPEDEHVKVEIAKEGGVFRQFYYTFPSGLELEADRNYVLYFEATDNDGLRGGKRGRSEEFYMRLLGTEALENVRLELDKELIENFDKTRESIKKSEKELEQLLDDQREKSSLNFEDERELDQFLQKQIRQERLMEKFSKALSENMQKEDQVEKDELLKERLERQEAEARRNAEMMEEMRKVLDKLDKEALQEKLEEIAKQQIGKERSLEQLLELTKRYYVEQKAAQLSRELNKQAERQERLSENENLREQLRKGEQKKLKEEFEDLKEELKELEKDNQDLRKPLPWSRDENKEQQISSEQEGAEKIINEARSDDNENNKDAEKANKKQKAAARKLKELSDSLQSAGAAGGESTMAEDAEMLRQILDNLVVYSLEQETLFESVTDFNGDQVRGSSYTRKQQQLRKLFEHVDDSLFALSLRKAEIAEKVNKEITDVYYNTDKALKSFSENQWYRGASYQQYVLTASNELAAFLADVLDNMQESLKPGKGSGGGKQLPDIIMSQEELQQQMQGSSSGKSGSQGESGEEKGEGESKDGESQGGKRDGGGEGSEGEKKSEEGLGKGSGQEGNEGNQGGTDELGYEEVYEIYKKQQEIRRELEKQLEDMIIEADKDLAKKIAAEMEQFENELLRSGITNKTINRLNRIQQQLMKLENAAMEQGEENRRKSNTNKEAFTGPLTTPPEVFRKQLIDVELLNRQVLPLRRIYKRKVKEYFKDND